QEESADRVHAVFRITDSTMPCGHTFDVPSETKRTTGVFWPPEIHLYRSRAARVVLLSTHREGRLPGSTTAHVRLEFVFLSCGARRRARQYSGDAIATIAPE